MLNDAMDNLQINPFEGPDSLINFALPIKLDEHLSLPRPGRRIWEELELLKGHNESTGLPAL
jgi:hypothetical protein